MTPVPVKTGDLIGNYRSATCMSAIGITDYREIGKVADHLKMLNGSLPQTGVGEVVVKLVASSMHIDEIYAAQGTALGRFYGPKKLSSSNPRLLGSSVSGTIVAVGENVTKPLPTGVGRIGNMLLQVLEYDILRNGAVRGREIPTAPKAPAPLPALQLREFALNLV